MIVNVSRRTGWVRVLLSVACLAALAWAVFRFATNHGSVYNNLGDDHLYYYVFLGLYLMTFLTVLIGFISGIAGVRKPGDAAGWVFNLALVVFAALNLWSAVLVQGSVVYPN
jgi:hypothetical protein